HDMTSKKRLERAGWIVAAMLAIAWALERYAGESLTLGILLACAPRGLYIGFAFALVVSALAARAWRTLLVAIASSAFAIGPLGGLELGSRAPATSTPI